MKVKEQTVKIASLKSLVALSGLVAVLCAAPVNATPTLITFDDIVVGGSVSYPITNPYQGLNWSNFGVINGPAYFADEGGVNGYTNGVVSAENVAFNGGGNQAMFMTASSGTFNLTSLYLTAAWNNDLDIQIDGKNSGGVLFTTTVQVDTLSPTQFVLNWPGLDEVVFTSSGGVNAGYRGVGTHFALDNVLINGVADIPEPGTVAFGVIAAGSIMGLIARKRKA